MHRLAYNDDVVAFKNGPPARRSEPDRHERAPRMAGAVLFRAMVPLVPDKLLKGRILTLDNCGCDDIESF